MYTLDNPLNVEENINQIVDQTGEQDLQEKVEAQEANAFFEEFLKAGSNGKCVDCSAADPQWVSVSHGVLVCFKCSSEHRSFGTHISVVKSTYLDDWTRKNLYKLKLSGNNAFIQLFYSYEIEPMELTMKQKYFSRVAYYYRAKLEAMANPSTTNFFKMPDNATEALEIVTEEMANASGFSTEGIGSDDLANRDPNLTYSQQSQWYTEAKERYKKAKATVATKYEEYKPYINERLEAVSTWNAETKEQIKNSETYKATSEYVSKQMDWFSQKASSYWGSSNTTNNENENGGTNA